jgi:hypothetical protein
MEAKVLNPIDQELDRLENEMRRLKIEYDIYFNGGSLRPPTDTRGRVDTTIKRLYDTRGISFGQRFRYNSLVARYNVLRELWRRQTQGREEFGRPPTVEAQMAARVSTLVVRCADPQREPRKVTELYEHLIAAKRECGERIGGLSLEVFSNFLASRAEEIRKNLSAEVVDFVVGVDKGRVKFVARPAEDKAATE